MKRRLLYLDTLRGVAALMVVIFHGMLFLEKNPSSISYWLTHIFDLGKIGVVIFFAISGFVIVWSLSEKKSLRSFWISRFLRLYPAYWLSLVCALFLGGGLLWQEVDWATIMMNLTMIQQFFGFENILGVYWTLGIEIAFYATISLLFVMRFYSDRAFFTLSLSFLAIALGLALLRFFLEKKLPVALPLSFSVMFFAALLQRVVVEHNSFALRYIKRYLLFFFFAIPIISLLAYNMDMGYNEVWYRYILSYVSAVLIFLWMVWSKWSSSVGVYIGKISYSIYLFHPIVMEVFRSLLKSLYHSYGLFTAISALILFTVAIASLIYHTVEQPFIAKKSVLLPLTKKEVV